MRFFYIFFNIRKFGCVIYVQEKGQDYFLEEFYVGDNDESKSLVDVYFEECLYCGRFVLWYRYII